ncbi:hypothetical protein F4781DRAFT_133225 [Annulohypoxylon bovei var. microspora]|nr:hypothetical protein F4781DRAFT_133225 [Annulohypoxylon bovei var. microspora]
MVNRLERLERFFGGSRRRDKERGERNRELSTVSTLSQPHDGQHFPAPSFMNPTSIHMKPREEPMSWTRAAKERSQSLPQPHGNRRRRSSIGSIGDILNHRYHPSDPIQPLSMHTKQADHPLGTPRLSHFRFPEALTMDEQGVTAKEAAYQRTIKNPQEENILDWYPQRVSSLFNNLGLDTSIDDRIAKFSTNGVRLLNYKPPSPTLSTPPSPRTRINTVDIPIRKSFGKPNKDLAAEFSFVLRNPLPLPFAVPAPDSPPASDNEEECSRSLHDQLVPTKTLASPIKITPRPSFDFNSRDGTQVSHSPRESWGTRPQDPVSLACTPLEEKAFVIRSRFVRRTGSMDSLSTITRYRPIDSNLREPTLDEFYSLDDDDVLECLPATPKPEVDIPPTPPPKDSPKTPIGRSRSTRHMPIAPTVAINYSSGELTPPRTPTDSHFLTLAYSPTNASGSLGAMWAASIANTYNFDLVYIVSLWPKGEGDSSDPSRQSTSTYRQLKAQDRDRAAARCSIVANPKSEVTGRILAAYGLNQFGSPFRIHAQFHRKMLGFKGWKEYRDELASPGMISRGWTCSFYSDHSTTARNETGDSQSVMANRGIVFAAYTKKTTKSAIPVRSTPKQTAVLGKLFYDAQTLVDALVHGA